jgi:homoserine O-acetyltransferase
LTHAAAVAVLPVAAFAAADYLVPKEGTFVAKDFRFHTGEVLPELRLHYRTIASVV